MQRGLAVRALAVAMLAAAAFGPTAAQAADKITVGVVSVGSALQWPLWIAIEKGFAQTEGLTIDPVASGGNNPLLQQVAAGAINVGLPAAGDSFRAIDKGAPLKVFRTDIEHVPHTIVARAAIASMADLKGKTISIGSVQGLDRVYLDRKVAAAGLAPGQYDVIGAGSTSHRFSALMSGAVDAAALSAPFNFRAVAAGYHDLGSVEFAGHHFPFTAYVGYLPWLEQHRAVVVHYLKAYADAVRWLNDASHKDEAVAILMRWGKSHKKDAELTYDLYRKDGYFLPGGGMATAELAAYIDLLASAGYIAGSRDPQRFFDLSYLAEATKGGH